MQKRILQTANLPLPYHPPFPAMKPPTSPFPAGTVIRLFLVVLTAVVCSACHTAAGFGNDMKHVGQKIESTAERAH